MPILRVLLRVQVKGPRLRRKDGGLIVASNHQSWLDPGFVQYALYPHQVTFLMTELFYDMPIAGLYFRAAGTRPIREGGRPSVTGLRAARDAIREGEIVCTFPEGGLTTTGELGEGRRGVARLARRSGAPVVPVGIRGAFHVFSKTQKWPRLHPVEVRVGAPIFYDEEDGREGEERFTARLMEHIRALAYD